MFNENDNDFITYTLYLKFNIRLNWKPHLCLELEQL
jgi:hypothetical protein